MKFKTKFTTRDTEDYKKWFDFYPKFDYCSLKITESFYFDPRPKIITQLTTLIMLIGLFFTGFSLWSLIWIPFLIKGWGQMYITLPFDSGVYENSEWRDWGFYFYNGGHSFLFDEIVISKGDKNSRFRMPWYLEWYRRSILLKNDSWEHELKGERKSFYEDEWKAKQKSWEYEFTDKYDNSKIPTTIYVQEMEWRRFWLYKLPLFNVVDRTIDVHFSKEVGSRKESWKGGTTGCSYSLLPNETPLDCIKRMENERSFR